MCICKCIYREYKVDKGPLEEDVDTQLIRTTRLFENFRSNSMICTKNLYILSTCRIHKSLDLICLKRLEIFGRNSV